MDERTETVDASRVKGSVGNEKRPPLLIVVGLGKGTEGPREEVGALWTIVAIVGAKTCIACLASNAYILARGPVADGAIYCSTGEGCREIVLRYIFDNSRISAALLSLFMLFLELGVAPAVRLSGEHKGAWYNRYPARALCYFFLGVITMPDVDLDWELGIITGVSTFAFFYAG